MMRNLILAAAVAAALTTPQSSAFAAAEHSGKTPVDIRALAGEACIFFRLEGVNVADPTVADKPWFSLRKNHPHFAELYALLVTARAGKLPLFVHTWGDTVCNCASVDLISLQ